MRSLAVALLLAGGVTVVAASPAVAVVYRVNSRADLPDANPLDRRCSTETRHCTLRAAIQQANYTSATDVVLVPGGRYVLSRTGSDNNGARGDLDLGGTRTKPCKRPQNDLIIVGAGRTTVIDGAGEDRVFDAISGRSAIAALVITDGRTVGGGGGVRVWPSACVAGARLTVIRNRAGGAGGGLFSGPGSDLDLRDSAIVDNETQWDGGGVELSGAFSFGEQTRTLTNVTITGNVAESTGGGIDDFAAPAELQNVTIAGNEAVLFDSAIDFLTDGSRIPAPANMLVSSSVIDGTCSGAGFSYGGVLQSIGHNLESGTSCGFATATDSQNTDPELNPIQWLSLTPFLQLRPQSPAIDHGDPTRCTPTDQLGVSRVGVCDAGAVERSK